MKCPNCGSTAQVERVGRPTLSKYDGYLKDNFNCGCGCNFDVEYAEDVNGYWQLSGVVINFMATREFE